jgi:hypothetical protein
MVLLISVLDIAIDNKRGYLKVDCRTTALNRVLTLFRCSAYTLDPALLNLCDNFIITTTMWGLQPRMCISWLVAIVYKAGHLPDKMFIKLQRTLYSFLEI